MAETQTPEPAQLGAYVLIPAQVLNDLVNSLGTITLQIGGLVTALQQSARPLGVSPKNPTGDGNG